MKCASIVIPAASTLAEGKSHAILLRRPHLRARQGFALIATISIMALLVMIALAMLSLSKVELRSSQNGRAMTEARANARMAMMIAIGELQKDVGPDQRITSPSAILDTDPATADLEGVAHHHLTGVWNARNDELSDAPDYSREPSFRRWLVSNADTAGTERMDFATNGSLIDPIDIAPGSTLDSDPVQAGRIPVDNGRLAWWVADENCKALANPRDDLDREANPDVAQLLAGFAAPGAHGMTTLEGLADFPTNTETSDKAVTLDSLVLVDPVADSGRLFHDVSPYPQSVLASVTRGGLRRDLSLYLERTDINWLEPWGMHEDANGLPSGPLGPDGLLALGDPAEYDVLPWKTLHHWAYTHRQQMADRDDLPLAALNSASYVDPVSNPAWNNGNTRLFPVVVSIKVLISFNAKRNGDTENYSLYLNTFPVVTLWNPYNMPLEVDAMHSWIASLPLVHSVYKNGIKHDLGNNVDKGTKDGNFIWGWRNGIMSMNMIGGSNPTITMAPGEARLFSYTGPVPGKHNKHDLDEVPPAWLPTMAGRERLIGTITGEPSDRISVGTACATWETSGSLVDIAQWQNTFEFRTEQTNPHGGHTANLNKQLFPAQVAWRHEDSNPRPDSLSESNFPTSTLQDLDDNPQPFLLLDVRLKTLDENTLPNKNWLHNIPFVPYVAATSTAKHSSKGVDNATTFFAHPYTVTFEQVNNVEGLFQTRPFFGSSGRPGGQERIVAAPFPLAPLTSLAQLQNLPLLPIDMLNYSGYHLQNLAVGNSFASPGLAPDQSRRDSFQFYLPHYLTRDGGDITGKINEDPTWFNNDQHTLDHSPARIVDRSYVANQLLFDNYFFSSMAAQTGPVFRRYGSERNLTAVVSEFLDGTTPLPVTSYQPYFPPGATSASTQDELIGDDGKATPEAQRIVAGRLLAKGGFNINSTSVEAWIAVLSAAKKKRPVTMPGGSSLAAQDHGEHVISRNPNPPLAGTTAADSDSRWLGYRELTDAQIRELAVAIVQQVKQRGPFRSLGEFVNRRLTTDPQTALYGAIQAALEDPSVTINADYRGAGKEISAADIAGTNYAFPEAALGSRYQGTPVYINQADILTPITPIIQARSDTFVVRGYGEVLSPDGNRILARAWCEAVVQRVPTYLNPADSAEAPADSAEARSKLFPVNQEFGRRFLIQSFRWLQEAEVS